MPRGVYSSGFIKFFGVSRIYLYLTKGELSSHSRVILACNAWRMTKEKTIKQQVTKKRTSAMIAAAGLLSVCLSATEAVSANASTVHHKKKVSSSKTTTKTTTKIANPIPLVVYSAQGYDKAETTAFSKKYHIPVSLDDNSTGPLLTQIEASKNNPKWGLLWVDGSTAFAALDRQGLLIHGFEPKVNFDSLGLASVPSDKSWVPTGVTLMAAMVYNKQKVTSPPTSWQQLLSAKWKGKVGMNDPSQSSPTYPFVAGMMNYLGSVAKGEKYFTSLKANGLVVNPTNGPTLTALANGQIDVALVQSSAGIGAAMSDKSFVVKYLNPVTLLPSCIGIDKKAPKKEQEEAKLFAEYVLSQAGQKVMQHGDPTGDSLYYPVVQGVNPLPNLPKLGGVKTQSINPYTWGPLESSVNSWFTAHIVQ